MYRVMSSIASTVSLVREFDNYEDAVEFRDLLIKEDEEERRIGELKNYTDYYVDID